MVASRGAKVGLNPQLTARRNSSYRHGDIEETFFAKQLEKRERGRRRTQSKTPLQLWRDRLKTQMTHTERMEIDNARRAAAPIMTIHPITVRRALAPMSLP